MAKLKKEEIVKLGAEMKEARAQEEKRLGRELAPEEKRKLAVKTLKEFTNK